MAVEGQPRGDRCRPARTSKLASAPADAGLGPVRVGRADVALDLVASRRPASRGGGEGGAAGLPVGEVAARLQPAAVDADDPADELRVAGRELQDDVAAPGLAGDDRPVEAQRARSAPRGRRDGRDVVRAVGLGRAAVAAEVDGERRVAGARRAAAPRRPTSARSTRGRGRARTAGRSRSGRSPSSAATRPPRGRQSSVTVTCRCVHRVRGVGIRPPPGLAPGADDRDHLGRLRARISEPRDQAAAGLRHARVPVEHREVGRAAQLQGRVGGPRDAGRRSQRDHEPPGIVDDVRIAARDRPHLHLGAQREDRVRGPGDGRGVRPAPPVMTVPPRRSVYSWVTHRGYTRAGYPAAMRTSVLVLGAGFGGLELSSRLVAELGDAVDVTLIDRSDAFVFGFAKLDMTFGRRTPESIRLPYAAIGPGVRFRRETITAIDPAARRVTTDAWHLRGRHPRGGPRGGLRPGRDPRPGRGRQRVLLDRGREAVREILPRSARVGVVGICGTPYKCPPAPSEAALLLDDHLRALGVRDAVDIKVVSPFGIPVPPSPEMSSAILARFAERGIEFVAGRKVDALDPATHEAVLSDGSRLPYDLFLGIPVHRAPAVVLASGLAEDGWIPVEKGSAATRFPGVYAVGDVTSVGTAKAGVFAERAARVVADQLIARIRGEQEPPGYDGTGACWMEFGAHEVGPRGRGLLRRPRQAPGHVHAAVRADRRREGRVRDLAPGPLVRPAGTAERQRARRRRDPAAAGRHGQTGHRTCRRPGPSGRLGRAAPRAGRRRCGRGRRDARRPCARATGTTSPSIRRSVDGSVVVTVAVRGTPLSRPISPKKSPAAIVLRVGPGSPT